MAEPKLSVLMTVRDGERHLAAAVESVLNQSFGDFEFLIRDDGSTDATPTLLRGYAERDARVRVWLGEPNVGIVPSMNMLFERAQGEFINRHDADDVSLPGRYQRQLAYLEAHSDIGLVASRIETIDEAGQPAPNLAGFSTATTHANLLADLLAGRSVCQGSVMFRRALLETVGLYDKELEPAEDHDLWLRMAEVTQLASLDEVLYQYRQHPGGVTKRRYFIALLSKATGLERAAQRRAQDQVPANQQQVLAHWFLRAGLEAQAAGETSVARSALRHASELNPQMWALGERDAETQVRDWFDQHTSRRPVNEALALVEAVFAELPAARATARLRGHLLAQLHLREVFAGARKWDRRARRRHLLAGVRHDPRWLLNRGVWVILARTLLGRGRPRGAA